MVFFLTSNGLFYSSKGILVEYLKEEIEKAVENLDKKGILDRLFN